MPKKAGRSKKEEKNGRNVAMEEEMAEWAVEYASGSYQ
jgi:hypothetical protein